MGSLNVTFDGICTHFPAELIRELGIAMAENAAWRVVLVQGVNGLRHMTDLEGEVGVSPHDAGMLLGDTNIVATTGGLHGMRQITPTSYLLRGVEISVANPVTGPLQLSNMTIIPSLHKHAQPAGAQPVPLLLSPPMVSGELAAAYFDISYGKLQCSYLGDASKEVAHATYQVDTVGAPRLNVRTFYDDSLSTIEFEDVQPASIIIQNVGEAADSYWDFLLHYRVCVDTPSSVIPPHPEHRRSSQGENDGLGSGCSNSQWP